MVSSSSECAMVKFKMVETPLGSVIAMINILAKHDVLS